MPIDPFRLPENLSAKAAPELLDPDRTHLAQIADALAAQRADVTRSLVEARHQEATFGDAAVDRDLRIRRLSSRLRVLERFGIDICLGRMTRVDGEAVYIGRVGLAAADGTRLLVDWRAPAAEPYFAATMEDPRGIVSRRRYRWTSGRISDYWDEALTAAGFDGAASLDDQSAFIASLGSHRTSRMRDVLATIQADQDAIIRTPSPVRSWWTEVRARGRPSSLFTVRPTCCTRRAAPHAERRRDAAGRAQRALPLVRRGRVAEPRRGHRAPVHPPRSRPRGRHRHSGAGSSGRTSEGDSRSHRGARCGREAVRAASAARDAPGIAVGRPLDEP
ncbi:hypothetical protein [Microbacterium sp. Se63.02b]|uniref:hypothetical protein n=1 Tax=Microbacterium sp. Se63.02b TaxID=2709304 RepID=UPI0031F605A5